MLTSRRAASRLKFAGKFATTRTRYGSATSPACALYSSIEANWLRRYFWITFSMCSVSIGQPLFDVGRLGPDAAVDQLLVVIGQVHERGEVLAEADRVDDREPHLARRQTRQQPQHNCLESLHAGGLALAGGVQQRRAAVRKRQQRRQCETIRSKCFEFRIGWLAAGQRRNVDRHFTEAHAGRHRLRRFPILPPGAGPIWKQPAVLGRDVVEVGPCFRGSGVPIIGQFAKRCGVPGFRLRPFAFGFCR